jgi:hypothetical protein
MRMSFLNLIRSRGSGQVHGAWANIPFDKATYRGWALVRPNLTTHREGILTVLKKTFVVFCLVLLSACATKRYGRMEPVSPVEQTAYTCRDIDIEISKVETYQDEMKRKSKIDEKSALGFLGDLGIGNRMEKHEAKKAARTRLAELQLLQAKNSCEA